MAKAKQAEVTPQQPVEPVEQTTDTAPNPKPARRFTVRVTDVIAFAVIIAVVVGLSIFIINRINLKNEVAAAKAVTDKAVAAMATQNTTALRSLGDSAFQAKNSAQVLSEKLTSTDQDGNHITFAELYGKTKPAVADQIVANNAKGQHVVIIYRYDRLKVPFYVRIDVTKTPTSDKWQLQALSASPDESKLLGN